MVQETEAIGGGKKGLAEVVPKVSVFRKLGKAAGDILQFMNLSFKHAQKHISIQKIRSIANELLPASGLLRAQLF